MMRFPETLRTRLPPAACAAILLFAAAGCGVGESLERDPQVVEDIRVDSLRFLPLGSRYVLRDSSTRVLFRKFHPGYACAEILQLDLRDAAAGTPPAFPPSTKVRFPARDCALDSSGRDSTVVHVFGAGPDFIRLANSSGAPTDSAQVVRGTFGLDSLQGKFSDLTHTFSRGLITVSDTNGTAPRSLFADSLPSCAHLNRAEYVQAGDSLKVRLSTVTLDPSEAPGGCAGPAHSETIPVLKAFP